MTHPIADTDWCIEEYPLASAGAQFAATTDDEESRRNMSTDKLYGPFQSRIGWGLAQWAKYETISSNALTWLLSINGVSYLTYKIEYLAKNASSYLKHLVCRTRMPVNSI